MFTKAYKFVGVNWRRSETIPLPPTEWYRRVNSFIATKKSVNNGGDGARA